MALNKPGPVTGAEYEAIQEIWGVLYEAIIDYPNGDTPKNVRPGYCGAFMCHFRDGIMSFPIPSFLLEILADLGLVFTQITPTFLQYVLTTFVWAREEGLEFGLADGIPNKDVNWTDKLFVFKIDPVTVGDFDFSWIPTKWNENVGVKRVEPPAEPSDANSDSVPPKRARGTPERRVLRSSSQAGSPVVLAKPVSVVPPAHSDQPESRVPGETSGDPSPSSSEPSKQDPGEGTSRLRPINLPPGSPKTFSYDVNVPILENPEQLASIWRKLRNPSCELPLLEQMRGGDAYVQMAVANAKAMEASNEYAALMEERLANFPTREELDGQLTLIQHLRSKLSASQASEQQRAKEVEDLKVLLTANTAEKVALEEEKVALEGDLESLKAKFKRDAELRDKAARRKKRAACRLVAKGYDAALYTARGTIRRRKAESAAKIRLQEVRAKIEALTEYGEDGFELEEELDRLKGLETSMEIDYGLAVVSDDSLRGLDLPQVSDDSVNLGG
ncbi:Uncharacterized protein Rs2_29135 [Raphanus sativus]|nr:Uncharacterized protein Rs2_29135 [Raphanus sativus]